VGEEICKQIMMGATLAFSRKTGKGIVDPFHSILFRHASIDLDSIFG